MLDFSHHTIETFPGINDKPVAPTANKAGNGPHLIAQHNNLVWELTDILNSIDEKFNIDNQVNVSGNSVGNFSLKQPVTKSVAGSLDAESAIKLSFPASATLFVSDWAMIFDNVDTRHEIRFDLSGNFPTTSLTYNWNGFNPSGFDIYWYSNQKYADNQGLDMSEDNLLNISICSDFSSKELHIYNRLDTSVNFLARITYANL